MIQESISQKNIKRLIVVSFTLLIPYVLLSLFIHPSGDDFGSAVLGRGGYFKNSLAVYFYWDGRYLTNFLLHAIPIWWAPLWVYKICALCFIMFLWGCSYWSLKKLTSSGDLSIIFTNIFVVLFISMMPDLSEGIYWYTGACTYLLSYSIFFVYSTSIIKKIELQNALNIPKLFFLLIVMNGLNETIVLILICLHILLFLVYRKDWFYRKQFLFLLTGQLLLAALVIFAPGNLNREANFENNHQLIHSIFYGGAYSVRFFIEWLINPAFWIAIFYTTKYYVSNSKTFHNPIFQNKYIIIALLILPTFIACFAPIWATGILGQHRTPNLSLFILLVTVFLLVRYNFKSISQTKIYRWLNSLNNKSVFIVFLICLALWKNGFYSLYDLASGNAFAFNNEMNKRYEILKKCETTADSSECKIPLIKHRPKSIFIYDISSNPDDWQNDGHAQFFQLPKNKKVVIQNDSLP